MQFTPPQKTFAAWALIAALLACVLWLLAPVLTPFVVAAVLAYALTPMVDWLDDVGRGRIPRMVAVVELALQIGAEDFTVIEGLRTRQRQQQLYDQGRTTSGPVVTWTMKSNHLKQEDGFGHAVDLAVIIGGVVHWERSDPVSKAMFEASRRLGTAIRWGADWDRDGKPRERGETDSPHFELVL